MTLSHQTFTSDCGCVIEQLHDGDDPTFKPVPIVLHNVCSTHLPLVKDKPKPSNVDKKKDDIIKNYKKMLADNRARHMHDWENSNDMQERKRNVQIMKQFRDSERLALREEAKIDVERDYQTKFLDNHEDDNLFRILKGLNNPYAHFAKEVHDVILSEQNG